jgi:pimeloyl-ACP methyl ester carboxylesterase
VTEANLPGFQERFAELDGGRIRYFVAGEGEPLLLLHGLGGGAANWVELAAALAEKRRVLVPDLPGHGRSAPLAGQPSMDDFAECAGRLAEYEGLVPAAVVGHSFGALVALRLALLHPDQVTSVVLAALPPVTLAAAAAAPPSASTPASKPNLSLFRPIRTLLLSLPATAAGAAVSQNGDVQGARELEGVARAGSSKTGTGFGLSL